MFGYNKLLVYVFLYIVDLKSYIRNFELVR